MASNIEIKAIDRNPSATEKSVTKLCGKPAAILRQRDIFFSCPNGRLKLRIFSSSKAELIFYRRENEAGPKSSYYLISESTDPGSLEKLLAEAYGKTGEVVKTRKLYMHGRTRIHLDDVSGLGRFIELEVVLEENESHERGREEANMLMDKLNIGSDSLIEGAYIDMIGDEPKNQ